MKVGYVVLYVGDTEASLRFWTDRVGMIETSRSEVDGHTVVQVGFADQDFAFELVPLALMTDNPDGLDLATPSIAFRVDDLGVAHTTLAGKGVQVTDLAEHSGVMSFGFADNEHRWFAVIRG